MAIVHYNKWKQVNVKFIFFKEIYKQKGGMQWNIKKDLYLGNNNNKTLKNHYLNKDDDN